MMRLAGLFLFCTSVVTLVVAKAPQRCTDSAISASRSFSTSRLTFRGGATQTREREDMDAFDMLARFLQTTNKFPDTTREQLSKTLQRLSSAQQALKGLDGAAHEAYQRTHSTEDIQTSVSGRAQRSAARLAVTAEALFACELVDLIEHWGEESSYNETLVNRQVVFRLAADDADNTLTFGGKSKLETLVLYEPDYVGGSGLQHGTMGSLTAQSKKRRQPPKGRLLVVVSDPMSHDMVKSLQLVNQKPQRVKLSSGLVTNEVASLQPVLYKAAGKLLEQLEPTIREYSNTTAIHFVGRSLAGGVASLAATMLDGSVPMPKSKSGKRKPSSKRKEGKESATTEDAIAIKDDNVIVDDDAAGNTTSTVQEIPLNGLGRARSSALSLGAPPCLSSNVLAAFCTSILYGDDAVVRATQQNIESLCGRIERNINGGFVGRNFGWMSETVSLTMSSLQSHAHGSEGEEIRLSIPGRAYLVRPRRFHGICSIHEVGSMQKGGREALRAGLLWQLNDLLLSKSMWRHHDLESYIRGLDRVQLRGSSAEDGAMH